MLDAWVDGGEVGAHVDAARAGAGERHHHRHQPPEGQQRVGGHGVAEVFRTLLKRESLLITHCILLHTIQATISISQLNLVQKCIFYVIYHSG